LVGDAPSLALVRPLHDVRGRSVAHNAAHNAPVNMSYRPAT
jgi:hypothetical protein